MINIQQRCVCWRDLQHADVTSRAGHQILSSVVRVNKNPEIVYSKPRIVNKVNIRMYIKLFIIYSMCCLIKFHRMNFCTRLPMPAGVCERLWWKVFFIATSSSPTILAATRLIWMDTYCTSGGPVKIIQESFHLYLSNILHTRLWKKCGQSSFWWKHSIRNSFVLF